MLILAFPEVMLLSWRYLYALQQIVMLAISWFFAAFQSLGDWCSRDGISRPCSFVELCEGAWASFFRMRNAIWSKKFEATKNGRLRPLSHCHTLMLIVACCVQHDHLHLFFSAFSPCDICSNLIASGFMFALCVSHVSWYVVLNQVSYILPAVLRSSHTATYV